MKILLTSLNSKYVHSNLALKYLFQAGKRIDSNIELREFTINNSRDYVFTELVRGEYDLVCFSCYIWNIRQTMDLVRDLKKACPNVLIALGGPEVSYDAAEFLTCQPAVDFLMVGEGEGVFPAFLRAALSEKEDFSAVPGLAYRGSEGTTLNQSAAMQPEQIPFPYETFSVEEDKVIYYESSRGCLFNCSYCISSIDRNVRGLPIDRVKKELDFFLSQGIKQVKFLDRTFNWDKLRSKEIFSHLIAADKGLTNFHMELCADLIDEELFQILADAPKGLFQFEIGIQSTNPETLQAIERTANTSETLKNVERLIQLGNSHIHVDLIAGLPYEDYKTFRESFNRVYELGAENLQLGFLKLLKGTKIRSEAVRHDYIFMDQAPYEVIANRYISAIELRRLKMLETVLNLYHNRGGFENIIPYAIDRQEQTPFDFYEAFSIYYYRGYQHKSHRKEDLYRILYSYLKTATDDQEMFQLLELDLEETMNVDAVKKFKKKGWRINP